MPPKYKTKLPTTRIKRIMRTDEDVGKIAQSTPVLIAVALESFCAAIVKASLAEAQEGARKLNVGHLKKAVQAEPKFDFLLDKVKDLADPQAELEGGETEKKPRKSRKKKEENQLVDV